MKKVFFIIFFAIFATLNLCAQDKFPQASGFVNDFVGVLSNQDKAKLEVWLSELEEKTTAQVAVVILETTKPLDIETYAVELFEKWGIGPKGKDNGALLLVALKDKKVRIEVGYGLEGAIPDALAKQIISNIIIPFFRQGDFSQGILQGALAIGQLVAKEYNVEISGFPKNLPDLPEVSLSKKPSFFSIFFRLLILLFFIFVFRGGLFWWLFLIPKTGHRRGGFWYGSGYGGLSGGFSGGFGGFGGGLSGGGGASGGW